MNETDEILLKRIANHQMLHGSFCGDPGILNGKMGVVIFFFHYARHTGNTLYEVFAGEMLDEVLEDLHDEVPIRFSNGLSGIGWGIEYLAQHQFVELSADEALQEIDNKVMERDLLRMKDVSWETGAQGIAAYVDMRLCHSANELSSFDGAYLQVLRKVCPEVQSWKSIWEKVLQTDFKEEELSWKHGLRILTRTMDRG